MNTDEEHSLVIQSHGGAVSVLISVQIVFRLMLKLLPFSNYTGDSQPSQLTSAPPSIACCLGGYSDSGFAALIYIGSLIVSQTVRGNA